MCVLVDLTGQRFGKLTVIKREGNKGREPAWLCKCDCGNEITVAGHYLRYGKKTHCGCEHINLESRTKLRCIYRAMLNRCYNPNDKNYHSYGERNITVCDEWLGIDGYFRFKKWAYDNGYDENISRKYQSIDRIDNEKGYSPDNCRFTDMKTQNNNRRSNVFFAYKGEIHTKSEWADILGIDYDTIDNRMNRGHTFEEAVSIPLNRYMDRENKAIRQIIRNNNIVNAQIADKVGVTPGTIAKWMQKPLDKEKEEKINNALEMIINEKGANNGN